MGIEEARKELLALLRAKAFERKRVTLASGRVSNFYINCKNVMLSARGHVLVGQLLFHEISQFEQQSGRRIAGVGGLTLGADPIASAVSMTSALAEKPIPAFLVRKEAKGHGSNAFIEGAGNIEEGLEVTVVEDVVTTGGSAMLATDRVRTAGYKVELALALVDREEGGREALLERGLELRTLFCRRDFLGEDP